MQEKKRKRSEQYQEEETVENLLEKYCSNLKYVEEILGKTKIGVGRINAIKVKMVEWIAKIASLEGQTEMLTIENERLRKEKDTLVEKVMEGEHSSLFAIWRLFFVSFWRQNVFVSLGPYTEDKVLAQ